VIVSVANFTGALSGATMSKARPVILSRPRISKVGLDGATALSGPAWLWAATALSATASAYAKLRLMDDRPAREPAANPAIRLRPSRIDR
jgi:hypothetical protein